MANKRSWTKEDIEEEVIAILKKAKSMTVAELGYRIPVGESAVRKCVTKLVAGGFVEQGGSGTQYYYSLV